MMGTEGARALNAILHSLPLPTLFRICVDSLGASVISTPGVERGRRVEKKLPRSSPRSCTEWACGGQKQCLACIGSPVCTLHCPTLFQAGGKFPQHLYPPWKGAGLGEAWQE